MSVAKIANKVAKLEGKKHEASVGDVREVIKVLVDVLSKDANAHEQFNDAVEAKAAKKGGYNEMIKPSQVKVEG